MRRIIATPLHFSLTLRAATSRVRWLPIVCTLLAVVPAGAQHTAQLAPATTKAFIHVPDANTLSANFKQTQFGELVNDPVTKPFADDLTEQLQTKFTEIDTRLGITWNDLTSVSSGQLGVAVIQPNLNPQLHAVVAMADTTGKAEQTQQLQQKIAAEMAQRGAKASNVQLGGVRVTKYVIPPAKGEIKSTVAYNCTSDGWLFAADNEQELANMLVRHENPANSLSTVAAYVDLTDRTAIKENASPDIQWFVEPFGYAAVLRAANNKRRKGKDYASILKDQGFDAIKGIGGAINFLEGPAHVIHRTRILATAGESRPLLTESAQILRFPAVGGLTPPDWVPANVANCLVLNTPIKESYTHIGGLFNAIQGDGFWEELLDGLKNEPNGPRLDLWADLVRHLGERVVMTTRPKLPVTVHSEHQLVAIETSNADQLMATFYPALDRDPTFVKIAPINGVTVWRHTPRDEKQRRRPRKNNPFGKKPPAVSPQAAAPPRALAISNGFLMYSTSEELLVEVLQGGGAPLGKHNDLTTVNAQLQILGAGTDSLRYFTRLEDSQVVNFGLMKSNQMAKSKTLLGQLLNELFEPEEPGVPRLQQINGAKLPAFEAISKYLGNGGVFMREESDGWEVTGAFLRK